MHADDHRRMKVRRLMDAHGFTQIALAAKLNKSQSWLSRRLSGVQHFKIRDLDTLAVVFGLTVPELFFDDYGQWDRRSKVDRRKCQDRRVRQTVIYGPVSDEHFLTAFPPRLEDGSRKKE